MFLREGTGFMVTMILRSTKLSIRIKAGLLATAGYVFVLSMISIII